MSRPLYWCHEMRREPQKRMLMFWDIARLSLMRYLQCLTGAGLHLRCPTVADLQHHGW